MAYTTIDDPSAYFKVQLYTGDGNASKAITFDDTDTNMQPDFVWIKRRDYADSNFVYDSVRFDGSNAYWLQTNNTNAQGSDRPLTAFGSDGFTIGSNNSALNGNTNTYVAWNWKEDATAGCDIVSYTGNGNADGIFVYTGFKPAWLLYRRSDDSTGRNWQIYDNKRSTFNELNKRLRADTSDAETTSTGIDFTSNGFKLRTSDGNYNASGAKYIYMTFAESPFVNSNGIPTNAR